MAKVKYRPPNKARNGSVTPVVYFSRDTVHTINEIMTKWPKRVARGQELVVAHAASMLRAELDAIAPKVQGYDYAQKLETVELPGTGTWPIRFAVVHPEMTRELGESGTGGGDGEENTLLYVNPKRRAPSWVHTLRKYSPWPAALMPASVPPSYARVIARTGSRRDIQQATNEIRRNRIAIEREMKRAGFNDVDLTQDRNGMASGSVADDLATAVLQVETGSGVPRQAHWKPALRRVERLFPKLADLYVTYIETGNEGVFRIEVDGRMSGSEFAGTEPFSDAIARVSGVGK